MSELLISGFVADARSSLTHDRLQQFLLLLYGHTANYQGRGSFISNEQKSLYQDPNNPSWRTSMGEIQASFCTPSQTLVASMTAMQLLDYDRADAVIWVARAAPRRWYDYDMQDRNSPGANSTSPRSSSVLFGVVNGPTRWGNVTFSVSPQVDSVTNVRIAVDFRAPVGAVQHSPVVHVRIRDTGGLKVLSSATVSPLAKCLVKSVSSDREQVTIAPLATDTKIDCTISAKFV